MPGYFRKHHVTMIGVACASLTGMVWATGVSWTGIDAPVLVAHASWAPGMSDICASHGPQPGFPNRFPEQLAFG